MYDQLWTDVARVGAAGSLCYSAAGRVLYVLHGGLAAAGRRQVLVLWSCGGVRPAARAARLLDLAAERPAGLPAWSTALQPHSDQ